MTILDPAAADGVDRLLDATSRAAMPAAEAAHLTSVVAASLHNAYLLAGVFAVLTLAVSWFLPKGLSPRHPTARP